MWVLGNCDGHVTLFLFFFYWSNNQLIEKTFSRLIDNEIGALIHKDNLPKLKPVTLNYCYIKVVWCKTSKKILEEILEKYFRVCLRQLLVIIHQISPCSAGIIKLAAIKHNYTHIWLPRTLHTQVVWLHVCVTAGRRERQSRFREQHVGFSGWSSCCNGCWCFSLDLNRGASKVFHSQ